MSRFVGALAIKAREVTNSLTLMIGMNINVGAAMDEITSIQTAQGPNLFKAMESGLEPVRKYYGLDDGEASAASSNLPPDGTLTV